MIIGEPRESPEVDSPAFGELQSAVANQQAAIVSNLLSTGGVLGVASGGTGSTSSSAARSALGAAPNSAAFITAQAESELSAEQSLGALTTGLLKNTVAAGVGTLSRAVAGTDYAIPGANNDITSLSALTSITISSAVIRAGNGTPEGAVVGSVGDLFLRRDGGAGTCLYVKESGSATNTGWIAK